MIGVLYASYDKASLVAPITEDISQDDVIDTICGQIVSNATFFHVLHINPQLTLYLVKTEESERHFFFSTYDNPVHAIGRIVIWEMMKK